MNGEIMNSPKGVKSGVQKRVSIYCPTCDTRHDLHPNNWKPNTKIPSKQWYSPYPYDEFHIQTFAKQGGGGVYQGS